tara:strand:+ start:7020 stop:7187 length:168 start_codon:yes stop_codon:yes gene_type:complete
MEKPIKLLTDATNFNKASTFVENIPKISDEKLTVYKIDFTKQNEYIDLLSVYIPF